MNPYYESIRLIVPKRRTPIGSFSVSDDGEFLFIFKDAIGIYDPYLKLVNEFTADQPGHFDCKTRYFAVSDADSFTFPVKFVDSDATLPSDVVHVAFSCCDRTSLNVESVEYRNHRYRNAEWSPTGVDQISRAVFSCVTSDYQLYIAFRVGDSWSGKKSLSKPWVAFWRSQGVGLPSESWQNFFEPPNDYYNESDSSDDLKFQTFNEYFSFADDASFLQSTWSKRIRVAEGPESSTKGCSNALLTALHKSGTISFWDVSVPIVDGNCVRLAAVDRTYSVGSYSSSQFFNPNFIKIVDNDVENFFLVIGFPSGRIICVFYQAYAKQMGLLSILRMGQHELCKSSSDQKPIGGVCFKDGILAVAKGTRVYLVEVFNHASVKPVCSVSSDDIMKPITGICFYESHLYISSEDGIIAKSTIPTPTKRKYEVTIIDQSPAGGDYYHRYYNGLHISPNGVHANFLEGTVAPMYCDTPTNLVLLPLMKSLDILHSIDTLKGPMRNNTDCLEEVNRLLQSFDLSTMTFPSQIKGKYDVDLEKDDLTDHIIAFCSGVILNTTADISKMELHKIQFRRAITMLISKNIPKGLEIKKKLKAQIDRYNRILALRQIDHCYRLFLKTEIQRQAQDCVLILRIATLCRRYFDSNPEVLKEASGLCGILQRATEAVIKIAEQLLNKRFKVDTNGIRPDALLMCPICEIERCGSTFIPVTDPGYQKCPSCSTYTLLLPDRSSQWRKEINGHFCPFCNVRMETVTFF